MKGFNFTSRGVFWGQLRGCRVKKVFVWVLMGSFEGEMARDWATANIEEYREKKINKMSF